MVTGERREEQVIHLAARDGDEGCIATKSPGLLIALLLDMGLSIPELHRCPYYTDISSTSYMIKVADIPNGLDRSKEIATRIERYDPIFFADRSLFDPAGQMEGLVQKLVPCHEEEGCSYSSLLFWCLGKELFKKVLHILFHLEIKNIRADQLQLGNSRVYLIWASDIESPVVLSKFASSKGVTIFYPILSTSNIWMEWGWRYGLTHSSLYNIFQSKGDESVFLFGDGTKVRTSRPNFFRLLKFMQLKFQIGTQTRIGEPRGPAACEFEYTLRLRQSTWRSWGRQEMERLLREEREIQERIEWLRSMESILAGQVTHKILFYPFGVHQKDPIFPHRFFRNHSLHQLRQLKFYYGKLGSLGDGVLVTGKHLIEDANSGGYEVASNFYPRNGLVFESSDDWMALAGLRVMTPEGFDLFPYLEVDPQDRRAIVNAFLGTAVCRIDEKEAQNIQENPNRYLYFIFPKQDEVAQDWKQIPLEGLVIHEDSFRDFDIKIANLGIHFARNDEEREIANQNFSTSVVQNITERFSQSVDILRTQLEDSFQNERKILKENIEFFINSIKEKKRNLTNIKKAVKDSFRKIKTKESIITGYEGFLEKRVGEYTSLSQEGSRNFVNFIREISDFMQRMNKDIDDIFKDNEEKYTKQIDPFLKEIKANACNTITSIEALLEKREKCFKELEEFKLVNEKFTDEFEKAKWNCLEAKENVQTIWNINGAFQGLNHHLTQVEEHLRNVTGKSWRGAVYSVLPQQDPLILEWFDNLSTQISQLRTKWIRESFPDDEILVNYRNLIGKCLQNLETSITAMKQWKGRHQDKVGFYGNVMGKGIDRKLQKYITKLKNNTEEIAALLKKYQLHHQNK